MQNTKTNTKQRNDLKSLKYLCWLIIFKRYFAGDNLKRRNFNELKKTRKENDVILKFCFGFYLFSLLTRSSAHRTWMDGDLKGNSFATWCLKSQTKDENTLQNTIKILVNHRKTKTGYRHELNLVLLNSILYAARREILLILKGFLQWSKRNRKLMPNDSFINLHLLFQVRLESIGAEDICDGNNRQADHDVRWRLNLIIKSYHSRLILGLIWTIILRFQIQEIEIDVVSGYDSLLIFN